MATYELGQVNLNPRGVYSPDTTYNRLDCVSWDGSSYIALEENTGAPVTDADTWMPLALGTSSDTAWHYLTLSLGATPGNYGAGRMRYKKIGNHVFIAGSVNVTPGSNIVLCNIPTGYRPSAGTATVINSCQGSCVARIAVYANGDFRLEWVANLSDGSFYTSGTVWVECSIDYWITGA